MTGRRETKKRLSRIKILKAASEIFATKGFDSATINEIADKADLGVGTVYNYFKSKDEIFIETFISDIDVETKFDLDIETLVEKEIAEIIMEYITKMMKPFKYIPKKLVKEFFRIVVGRKSSAGLLSNLMEMDFKFIDRIEEVLDTLKERGVLPTDYDSRMSSELCYSAYMYEFMLFLMMDDYDFDKVNENTRNKFSFIFNGKTI